MNTVYIALGSNVGDRLDNLRKGKDALARHIEIIATSLVYDTEPIDADGQTRFLNAVVSARTNILPEEVLSLCLVMERKNGRVRSEKNAPRTLDLDLILYDDLILDTSGLTLPHPRMHQRAFVLAPLADIAPDLIHPTLRVSIKELLERCETTEQLLHSTGETL